MPLTHAPLPLTYYVTPIVTLAAAGAALFLIIIVGVNYLKRHSIGKNAWIIIPVAVLLFGFSFWQSVDINASLSGFSMKVRAKLAEITKNDDEFTRILANCIKNQAGAVPDKQQEKLQTLITERQNLLAELASLLEQEQPSAENVVLVRYILNGNCVALLVPADQVNNFKESRQLC